MLRGYLEEIIGDLQCDFDVKIINLLFCIPQILEKNGIIMERYNCRANTSRKYKI